MAWLDGEQYDLVEECFPQLLRDEFVEPPTPFDDSKVQKGKHKDFDQIEV